MGSTNSKQKAYPAYYPQKYPSEFEKEKVRAQRELKRLRDAVEYAKMTEAMFKAQARYFLTQNNEQMAVFSLYYARIAVKNVEAFNLHYQSLLTTLNQVKYGKCVEEVTETITKAYAAIDTAKILKYVQEMQEMYSIFGYADYKLQTTYDIWQSRLSYFDVSAELEALKRSQQAEEQQTCKNAVQYPSKYKETITYPALGRYVLLVK